MKERNFTLLICIAVLALTVLPAAAQGPNGRGGQGHQPPVPAIDAAIDADGDEVISGDEIANAAAALIELDADNNGGLSFDECMGFSAEGGQQAPPAGRGDSGGKPPAPPVFSALDSSGNEVIDEYEIADAPSSLLELDENGDGQLQPDEYRPSHAGGRPPRDR